MKAAQMLNNSMIQLQDGGVIIYLIIPSEGWLWPFQSGVNQLHKDFQSVDGFIVIRGKKVIFTEFVRWATEGIVSHERMFDPVTDCKAKKGLDVMQTKFEPDLWQNTLFVEFSFQIFSHENNKIHREMQRRVATHIESLSTLEVWPLMRLCEITVLSFRSVPCLYHPASDHRPLSC